MLQLRRRGARGTKILNLYRMVRSPGIRWTYRAQAPRFRARFDEIPAQAEPENVTNLFLRSGSPPLHVVDPLKQLP